MKEILESKECKEYIKARNNERFTAITLANTKMSQNPIAIALVRDEYNAACKELDAAKQMFTNFVFSYIDSLT